WGHIQCIGASSITIDKEGQSEDTRYFIFKVVRQVLRNSVLMSVGIGKLRACICSWMLSFVRTPTRP
ncbi:hypothetical protein D823_09722, partial [Streptococcus sobrinus DSM 20742 = ATCC 33478]